MLFRTLMAAIALNFLAASAFAVDGTNLPGYDYRNFEAPHPTTCMNSCGGDVRCQAYTWVKPGYQGPKGRCYLKVFEPKIVKSKCCDSGPRRFIYRGDLKAEFGIDRPGADYKDLETDEWEVCEAECRADTVCRSWTFAYRTEQSPGRCWLKNKVANPTTNEETVSGVKFVPAAQRID
jgi:PAN domain